MVRNNILAGGVCCCPCVSTLSAAFVAPTHLCSSLGLDQAANPLRKLKTDLALAKDTYDHEDYDFIDVTLVSENTL